jgi:rhodanese-related sulfurtransferase
LQDLSKIIKSDKRPGKDYLVVDVRDSDFIGGHIPNCRNEPSETFLDTVDDLIRDTKDVPQVIFHCALSQARWVTAYILYDLRESDYCERYPGVQRLHG